MPDDKLSTTDTNGKRKPWGDAWDDVRSILCLWLMDKALDVAPEREKAAVARGVLVAARGIRDLGK